MDSLFVSQLAVFASLLALVALLWLVKRQLKRLKDIEGQMLEAQRLLRLRGNLASEIAHEIKNPISAILCSAETLDLLIGKDIAEEHRVSLQYIKDYGDSLLQLVSDFLDVSMAESGHLKLRPAVIDIDKNIRSVVGLLESNAIKNKVKIQHRSTLSDLKVLMDPKHFKQVIFNLVHNAIRFTPEGGEIHVVVKSDFPKPSVTIEVKDNGVGIPEKEIPTLFDLYQRYEGNQPKFGTGLGLGLSLCKTFCELANGSIAVSSTVGEGTCFAVCLPVYCEEPVEISKSGTYQALSAQQPLLGLDFLLLNADKGACETLGRLIQAWGGQVEKASAQSEAMLKISERDFDAILVDSMKNIDDASELMQSLQAQLEGKATSIILEADDADAESQALAAGADSCVQKPFSGEELLQSLVRTGKLPIRH